MKQVIKTRPQFFLNYIQVKKRHNHVDRRRPYLASDISTVLSVDDQLTYDAVWCVAVYLCVGKRQPWPYTLHTIHIFWQPFDYRLHLIKKRGADSNETDVYI